MSESNGGTNGAAAVADPGSAQAAIQAVANVAAGQRPFTIPAELAKKIAQARKGIGAVAKNGHNADQHYNYVQIEDVVQEAGRALAEASVIVMPGEPIRMETEDLRSGGGASGKLITVTFLVRVIDGETGEGYETEQIGMASDYPGDKALAKARSSMKKYFLADLLEIPLGDGTDAETTKHGKGGAKIKDDSPASDKQKDLVKKLIGEKNLPKPAKAAIVNFIGGSEPKKGPTSHAIDQLMNHDPLAFARECGWDGTVEEAATEPQPAPAEAPAEPEAAAPQPSGEAMALPEAEGEALVLFCREKGATAGELATVLRSIGINLPPTEDLSREQVIDAMKTVPVAQVARVKQMVMASYESKKAAAEAAEQAANPQADTEDAAATPAEPENTTTEVDPKSPLGKATEKVAALGYKSEFGNLSWLLFNTDQPGELDEGQLTRLTGLLDRAATVGIQQSSVAACIRNARESDLDVETRGERFEGWIANREQNAQATQAAQEAHDAAEGPQQ